MAVAFVTHSAPTQVTGDTIVATIVVSGTNPVLGLSVSWSYVGADVVSVSSNVDGALTQGALVTSGGGGNPAKAGIYYKAAPTAGSHTITFVVDDNRGQIVADAWVFQGAHQTTPVTNPATSTTIQVTTVLTPGSLTANDATTAVGTYVPGDWASASPNQRTIDNSTACTHLAGDATGTTGVTLTATNGSGDSLACAAVRIAASAGGANTDRQTVVGAATVAGVAPTRVVGVVAVPLTP